MVGCQMIALSFASTQEALEDKKSWEGAQHLTTRPEPWLASMLNDQINLNRIIWKRLYLYHLISSVNLTVCQKKKYYKRVLEQSTLSGFSSCPRKRRAEDGLGWETDFQLGPLQLSSRHRAESNVLLAEIELKFSPNLTSMWPKNCPKLINIWTKWDPTKMRKIPLRIPEQSQKYCLKLTHMLPVNNFAWSLTNFRLFLIQIGRWGCNEQVPLKTVRK